MARQHRRRRAARHHGRGSMLAIDFGRGSRAAVPCVRCRDHDGRRTTHATLPRWQRAAAGRAARRRRRRRSARDWVVDVAMYAGRGRCSARSCSPPPWTSTAGSRSPSTSRSARSRSSRCGGGAAPGSRSAVHRRRRRRSVSALAGGAGADRPVQRRAPRLAPRDLGDRRARRWPSAAIFPLLYPGDERLRHAARCSAC